MLDRKLKSIQFRAWHSPAGIAEKIAKVFIINQYISIHLESYN